MKKELKKRITSILEVLNEDIYEREEIFSVSLLSALADQNIFLYGPPGTAKSLISRRLSKVFKSENYFEYLMQKFSTPDEVFGPVSIKELKNDNYIRKTDGYLPEAKFVFLDEIWKSSPAILNTLLTAINEKKFKNGTIDMDLPLKFVISASNETPPKGQGLEALYDRFLTRLYVNNIENRENFEKLSQNGGSSDSINIDEKLLITDDEWQKWKNELKDIKISSETYNIINTIKIELSKQNKKLDCYVSDRRWVNAISLLKASAYFSDRDETNIVDCLLLSYCLWDTNDNRAKISQIVEDAVRDSGFDTGYSLDSIDKEKEDLEKEINKELLYSNDIYETVKLKGNNQYFKSTVKINNGYNRNEDITFYMSKNKQKTKNVFHPVDENGNVLKWLRCDFRDQGSCKIECNYDGRNNSYSLNDDYCWEDLNEFKPTIQFHKGDKKEEINPRLVKQLLFATIELKDNLSKILQETKSKKDNFIKELDTPFIPQNKIDIAIKSVDAQIDDLSLRVKDCERLESMIK